MYLSDQINVKTKQGFFITLLVLIVLSLLLAGCAKNDNNKSASDTQESIPDDAGSNAFSLTLTNTNPSIGRIDSSPDGIDCGEKCSRNYSQDTLVVLTAKAAPGYDFDGWNGCDSNDGIRCTITMTEDKNIIAGFSLEALFIVIPGGIFQMGDLQNQGAANELPVHSVSLKSYSIMKREVTVWDYKVCAESGGCTYSGSGSNETWNVEGKEDHPINYISWNDVQDYINWANQNSARTHTFCTEAQWEYAARAGTTTTWACGNEAPCLPDMAWSGDNNSLDGTKPVKTKIPNAWGLYDMHGNVFEWVNDWYDENYYSNSAASDPAGPASGSLRVVRGGSFYYPSYYARSSYRSGYSAGSRYSSFGFRLCAIPLSSDSVNSFTLSLNNPGNGTVDSSPDGIQCADDCEEVYTHGTTVTLTASPDTGYTLGQWTGCNSYSGNSCTVKMSGNKSVTAKFEVPAPRVLSVSKEGGNGTVSSFSGGISCGNDCNESYLMGRSVTLTQTPDSGYDFKAWLGCDASNDSTCSLTMNRNRTVIAIYKESI